MSIDDIIKLLLAVSISFSIVGISYQLMRLLGSFTENIQELRTTVKNFGEFTDKIVRDYDFISEQVKEFAKALGRIASDIINPIANMLSFLKKFKAKKE